LGAEADCSLPTAAAASLRDSSIERCWKILAGCALAGSVGSQSVAATTGGLAIGVGRSGGGGAGAFLGAPQAASSAERMAAPIRLAVDVELDVARMIRS